MGFLSGSMTFTRYEITKDSTGAFGEKHMELLGENKIGSRADGNLLEEADFGFVAGEHIFDTDFRVEKNVIGEALHFAVRIDSVAVPASIKRAWMKMELAGILLDNQGSRPTREQKEEAEAAVNHRIQDEVAKGRFRRMAVTSVLWDAAESVLYVGSNSEKNNDAVLGLLESVFSLEFEGITPTQLALGYTADDTELYEQLNEIRPTPFVEDGPEHVSWWNGMGDNYDYLGNEFLLWLWWHLDNKSTVVDLPDESDLSGMFTKTLLLDCPMGESGKETISSISPVALPEAMMAIRMGKQPRKAGLNLTRDGEQFEFTLHAETFNVNAGRMVNQAEANPGNDPEVRIQSVRNFAEAIDLLFEAFLGVRIGKSWTRQANQIRNWLAQDTVARRVVEAA